MFGGHNRAGSPPHWWSNAGVHTQDGVGPGLLRKWLERITKTATGRRDATHAFHTYNRVFGVTNYSDSPLPDDLDDAPNSAKLVYLTLYHHGPLTRKEIARYAHLNPGNLHRQFAELRDANVLTEETIDAKSSRYDVTE